MQKNKVWKKKLRKLFGKGRTRREMNRKGTVRSSQNFLKSCKNSFECKSRSYFYRLFMSGQENHWKSYNLEKIMSRVTTFDLLFKSNHW